jgi:glutamate synthase domain-containing protein 2
MKEQGFNVGYIDKKYLIMNRYLPPLGDKLGFWNRLRIEGIRYAAEKGVEHEVLSRPKPRGRILDRLSIKEVNVDAINNLIQRLGIEGIDRLEVDVGVDFASKKLSTPIYIGDMSFGALSGNPNIALARAADIANVVIGIGEGGLHPEVGECSNIVIQWASGRFGIDRYMIRKGIAVTIKIGQGAKPGIGGHLPGEKVVDDIAKLRRIPPGSEALSPAPHHDIYSIEDLAQRVRMLNELTGKPVLVKAAAGHQARFIAVGIARAKALGAIIDGAGAGTGAAPKIVRDHVGVPIDFVISITDRLLRDNGLRDGFLLIAGGMIASGQDIFKSILLGANMVNISTALLIAMGCIMCHKCNTGKCPAALTNSLSEPRRLDIGWGVKHAVNWLKAVERSLKILTYSLGEDKLQNLVGRRDLLELYYADKDVAEIIDVVLKEPGQIAWYEEPQELDIPFEVMFYGKTPVVGMGGIVPGYTTPAERPLDLLRIEAAQVTRPSIDPYREEIDLRVTLHDGVTYEAPIVVPCIDDALVDAAEALGYPIECELLKYSKLVEVSPGTYPRTPEGIIIVDEGEFNGKRPWLEEWVVVLDDEGRRYRLREKFTLVAAGRLKDGADIYKLIALGADAVLPRALFNSVKERIHGEVKERRIEVYENVLIELSWELRLLMGAGGVTSYKSLRGNRWLLRSLDGYVARVLNVDIAGI